MTSDGCQTAILLNIPGTPASAATAVDGFPMARQGRAGYAIILAITSSALGTIVSVIFLLTLTPLLTQAALHFGAWEFFLLAAFGIAICGTLTARDNALKSRIAGFLGLFVAQIGLDPLGAAPRFAFGNTNLMGGIALIPILSLVVPGSAPAAVLPPTGVGATPIPPIDSVKLCGSVDAQLHTRGHVARKNCRKTLDLVNESR